MGKHRHLLQGCAVCEGPRQARAGRFRHGVAGRAQVVEGRGSTHQGDDVKGTVLYGSRDIRFEEREDPKIVAPTDAIIRMSATCVCGSDVWPYRGIQPIPGPTPMGHEYCGVVEEVGKEVRSI